ncbi:hypothetical protein CP533_0989 [Ophiocordyceps camponoti-saundersi (nom. inval.)]|nr:hypothetical protein CP533_0989 [Ophiocordyceps camponoti-saundersi (nom. inval.)]
MESRHVLGHANAQLRHASLQKKETGIAVIQQSFSFVSPPLMRYPTLLAALAVLQPVILGLPIAEEEDLFCESDSYVDLTPAASVPQSQPKVETGVELTVPQVSTLITKGARGAGLGPDVVQRLAHSAEAVVRNNGVASVDDLARVVGVVSVSAAISTPHNSSSVVCAMGAIEAVVLANMGDSVASRCVVAAAVAAASSGENPETVMKIAGNTVKAATNGESTNPAIDGTAISTEASKGCKTSKCRVGVQAVVQLVSVGIQVKTAVMICVAVNAATEKDDKLDSYTKTLVQQIQQLGSGAEPVEAAQKIATVTQSLDEKIVAAGKIELATRVAADVIENLPPPDLSGLNDVVSDELPMGDAAVDGSHLKSVDISASENNQISTATTVTDLSGSTLQDSTVVPVETIQSSSPASSTAADRVLSTVTTTTNSTTGIMPAVTPNEASLPAATTGSPSKVVTSAVMTTGTLTTGLSYTWRNTTFFSTTLRKTPFASAPTIGASPVLTLETSTTPAAEITSSPTLKYPFTNSTVSATTADETIGSEFFPPIDVKVGTSPGSALESSPVEITPVSLAASQTTDQPSSITPLDDGSSAAKAAGIDPIVELPTSTSTVGQEQAIPSSIKPESSSTINQELETSSATEPESTPKVGQEKAFNVSGSPDHPPFNNLTRSFDSKSETNSPSVMKSENSLAEAEDPATPVSEKPMTSEDEESVTSEDDEPVTSGDDKSVTLEGEKSPVPDDEKLETAEDEKPLADDDSVLEVVTPTNTTSVREETATSVDMTPTPSGDEEPIASVDEKPLTSGDAETATQEAKESSATVDKEPVTESVGPSTDDKPAAPVDEKPLAAEDEDPAAESTDEKPSVAESESATEEEKKPATAEEEKPAMHPGRQLTVRNKKLEALSSATEDPNSNLETQDSRPQWQEPAYECSEEVQPEECFGTLEWCLRKLYTEEGKTFESPKACLLSRENHPESADDFMTWKMPGPEFPGCVETATRDVFTFEACVGTAYYCAKGRYFDFDEDFEDAVACEQSRSNRPEVVENQSKSGTVNDGSEEEEKKSETVENTDPLKDERVIIIPRRDYIWKESSEPHDDGQWPSCASSAIEDAQLLESCLGTKTFCDMFYYVTFKQGFVDPDDCKKSRVHLPVNTQQDSPTNDTVEGFPKSESDSENSSELENQPVWKEPKAAYDEFDGPSCFNETRDDALLLEECLGTENFCKLGYYGRFPDNKFANAQDCRQSRRREPVVVEGRISPSGVEAGEEKPSGEKQDIGAGDEEKDSSNVDGDEDEEDDDDKVKASVKEDGKEENSTEYVADEANSAEKDDKTASAEQGDEKKDPSAKEDKQAASTEGDDEKDPSAKEDKEATSTENVPDEANSAEKDNKTASTEQDNEKTEPSAKEDKEAASTEGDDEKKDPSAKEDKESVPTEAEDMRDEPSAEEGKEKASTEYAADEAISSMDDEVASTKQGDEKEAPLDEEDKGDASTEKDDEKEESSNKEDKNETSTEKSNAMEASSTTEDEEKTSSTPEAIQETSTEQADEKSSAGKVDEGNSTMMADESATSTTLDEVSSAEGDKQNAEKDDRKDASSTAEDKEKTSSPSEGARETSNQQVDEKASSTEKSVDEAVSEDNKENANKNDEKEASSTGEGKEETSSTPQEGQETSNKQTNEQPPSDGKADEGTPTVMADKPASSTKESVDEVAPAEDDEENADKDNEKEASSTAEVKEKTSSTPEGAKETSNQQADEKASSIKQVIDRLLLTKENKNIVAPEQKEKKGIISSTEQASSADKSDDDKASSTATENTPSIGDANGEQTRWNGTLAGEEKKQAPPTRK